jgi:Helix-turn-helix domain
MRYSASEKLEIIRTVETSHLPVRRTLDKIGIPKTTFYAWLDRYAAGGFEALEDRKPRPRRIWNRIPDEIRDKVYRAGAGRVGALAARGGRCLHRCREDVRLRGQRLTHLEGRGARHLAGLHRHECGRSLRQPDDSDQPALANRLHLPQGHRLVMVLSLDGARRLLALHRRLEALHHDERRRRHRRARAGLAGVRARRHQS